MMLLESLLVERTPVFLTWEALTCFDRDKRCVYRSPLMEVYLVTTRGLERYKTPPDKAALYWTDGKLDVKVDSNSFSGERGGVVGLPAGKQYSIDLSKAAIEIVYSADPCAEPSQCAHGRPWFLETSTAGDTLAEKHGRPKERKNGLKLVPTSVYPGKEIILQGGVFTVPGSEKPFPVLLSRDISLAVANRQDDQDLHCHQNTVEIIVSDSRMVLDYLEGGVIKTTEVLGGVIILPSLTLHKIHLYDDVPALFFGIRETDAGTDKIQADVSHAAMISPLKRKQ